MSDLVAHLHVKFCTINALLKHYVLIGSRQCFNSVSVKCLGPFFFPYGPFSKSMSSKQEDFFRGGGGGGGGGGNTKDPYLGSVVA